MTEPVQVAIALVNDGGRWLVSRRAPGRIFGGLWEFPGGKMEPGESPENAAAREANEETGLQVVAAGSAGSIESHHGGEFVILHLVRCRPVSGQARPMDESVEEIRWVTIQELSKLPMPPANSEIIRRLSEDDEVTSGQRK